ncbi:MAG TPA: hypothetical protein VF131_26780 [Blastocatellia bacterium]|nr:hypothetical protein [Blastocatellia bacterium]
MIDKISLFHLKDTKHVIGAVTHTADPDRKASAATLAPGGVLIRDFVTMPGTVFTFLVPPDEVDVISVDFDEELLLQPRRFVIGEDKKPAPQPTSAINTATLTATKITITPNAGAVPVTEDTFVWVQVSGGSLTTPIIKSIKIEKGSATAEFPLTRLTAGTYQMLALATGRLPRLEDQILT